MLGHGALSQLALAKAPDEPIAGRARFTLEIAFSAHRRLSWACGSSGQTAWTRPAPAATAWTCAAPAPDLAGPTQAAPAGVDVLTFADGAVLTDARGDPIRLLD